MVDMTRRDLLKTSVVATLLPILPLSITKNEEEKIYYKVVTSTLRSARHYPKSGAIQYKINEWVTPPIGKIFIFETKKDAIQFQLFYEKIYKCVVKNPTKAKYYAQSCMTCLVDFWKNYNKPAELAKMSGISKPPKGTIYCDAVKLLEEVTNG